MNILIREQFMLEDTPSGSALEKVDDRLFVFGDDSPFLHIFSNNWHPLEVIELPGQDTQHFRIPKPVKHDIESAFSTYQDQTICIYALGSGAVSPYRDIVYQVHYTPLSGWMSIENITATPFYEQLRTILGKNGALNLEGAALSGDLLILSQRGHLQQGNYLFLIPFRNKETFTDPKAENLQMIPVELPEKLNGYGLSGLAWDTEYNRLWCCGSYENITDTYNDGEIGQSFIGFLEPVVPGQTDCIKLSNWSLIFLPEHASPVKLESLVIENSYSNSANIFAIADDDNGGTEVLLLEVNW